MSEAIVQWAWRAFPALVLLDGAEDVRRRRELLVVGGQFGQVGFELLQPLSCEQRAEVWLLASERWPPPRLPARARVLKVVDAEVDGDPCELSTFLFHLVTRIVRPGMPCGPVPVLRLFG